MILMIELWSKSSIHNLIAQWQQAFFIFESPQMREAGCNTLLLILGFQQMHDKTMPSASRLVVGLFQSRCGIFRLKQIKYLKVVHLDIYLNIFKSLKAYEWTISLKKKAYWTKRLCITIQIKISISVQLMNSTDKIRKDNELHLDKIVFQIFIS